MSATLLEKLKMAKKHLMDVASTYKDAYEIVEDTEYVLNPNTIMTMTNFDKAKDYLSDESRLDMTNRLLIDVRIVTFEFYDDIIELLSKARYIDQKSVVTDEYLKVSKTSNEYDKLLIVFLFIMSTIEVE